MGKIMKKKPENKPSPKEKNVKSILPSTKKMNTPNKRRKSIKSISPGVENVEKPTFSIPQVRQTIEGLDVSNFEPGVDALLKLLNKTDNDKKLLLDDVEQAIVLQIGAIKIPKCRERIIRANLKHCLYSEDSDICLIVSDLPNCDKNDYDKAVEFYEDLLKKNNITGISTIMTYHQLRKEYEEFEMKRKLANAYDLFLVDSRVIGNVKHKLGSVFDKLKKNPNAVCMKRNNLKGIFEFAKFKTQLKIHGNGNCFGVKIGHSKMTKQQILDNLFAVVLTIKEEFPGGLENIRSFNLKSGTTMAVPIYLTLKNKTIVDIPIIHPKARNPDVTDELSTKLNSNVTVKASGEVIITKGKRDRLLRKINIESDDEDDEKELELELDDTEIASENENDENTKEEDEYLNEYKEIMNKSQSLADDEEKKKEVSTKKNKKNKTGKDKTATKRKIDERGNKEEKKPKLVKNIFHKVEKSDKVDNKNKKDLKKSKALK